MSKKKAIVIYHDGRADAYDVTEKGAPVLMDEKYLRRNHPYIGCYTDAHKRKALKKTLEKMDVRKIKIPSFQPNAKRKLCLPNEGKREPGKEDFTKGVCGLFEIAEIWENPFSGFWLISSMLTAMHCASLRRAGPETLFYVTEIKDAPQELIDLISNLIRAVVTKKRWKRCMKRKGKKARRIHVKVRRKPVLDFRATHSAFSLTAWNFAEVTVKAKKRKVIHLLASYEDTISAVVGADKKQLRETLPLMEQSYVLLIKCQKPDGVNPSVFKVSDMERVFHDKIEAVKRSAPYIAALLRWWWEIRSNEDIWAAELLRKAKGHLAKPNEDYVSISPNPVKLRHAVQYEILLSFVETAIEGGFLPREEAEQYCVKIQEAFYPEPVVTEPRKRMEDTDVFLNLMRSIVQEKSTLIVAEEERFVKSEKRFGALRKIGNNLYLVMPEEEWANAYKKAAKNAGLETSFSQSDGWERNLQKILADAGLIKYTSGNPRYRYDLYAKGSKDKTYVVALPWNDVKPQE